MLNKKEIIGLLEKDYTEGFSNDVGNKVFEDLKNKKKDLEV